MAESWAAVKAGRCAVGPITAFDATDFKVKLAAEVKDFDPVSYTHLPGQTLACIGFGGGLTWGGMLLTYEGRK